MLPWKTRFVIVVESFSSHFTHHEFQGALEVLVFLSRYHENPKLVLEDLVVQEVRLVLGILYNYSKNRQLCKQAYQYNIITLSHPPPPKHASVHLTEIHSYLTILFSQYSFGVFPKWSRTFIEFGEFRESDKSLKHELNILSVTCVISCAFLTLLSLT